MDNMTSNSICLKPNRLLLAPFLCLGIVVFGFLTGCTGIKQPVVELKIGTPASNFILTSVRGDAYELKSLEGQAVLLSFINTQAEIDLATPDPSRAQIIFLKSMHEQYASRGLSVFIVDAAQLEIGKQPSLEELINFTHNWQLGDIPVLVDKNGLIRDQYGISSLPTTLLIGTDGVIQQRWNTMASSSQLALAIESVVGIPLYRITSTNATPALEGTSCFSEPLAQARFSGVGLARSLSDEIWVVDNGQGWGTDGNYPLQWIVLDHSGKAGKNQLRFQVTGEYFNSENFILIDQILEQLPDDEARGLLGGTSGNLPNVYFITTTISLDMPGCLQVQAVVTDIGSGAIFYTGEMFVSTN